MTSQVVVIVFLGLMCVFGLIVAFQVKKKHKQQ